MAMPPAPRPFYELPSFAEVRAAFGPLGVRAADCAPPVAPVVHEIEAWNAGAARTLEGIARSGAGRRFLAIEAIVSRSLALIRRVDTVAIHEWLHAAATDPTDVQRFRAAKAALAGRYDALVRLLGEAASAAEIARPSDVGNLRAGWRNMGKLMRLLGARGARDRLGILGASVVVAWRERGLLRDVLGRILRTHPALPFGGGNRRLAARINARVGFTAVDATRGEDLRAARRALGSKGVRGHAADEWITRALLLSHAASGRAWKGLVRLTELITHGDLDPSQRDFDARLHAAMDDAVHYTHVPGAEVVVRDYALGARLAMLDGKVDRASGRVALTQGGGSVVPGIFRHGPAGLAAGRKYLEPLDLFLRSMVTADGNDHKTQKGVFNRFFGWGSVLATTPFVEATLERLLDRVEALARRQRGVFDFKMDFAFHYPIAVICHMLGIPQEDAPRVQVWAEDFVRALDAGTGISPGTMAAGNRAAQEFRAYLGTRIEQARAGRGGDGIIAELARKELPIQDETLVANLIVLIFAGFETTTGLLAMGLNELLKRREQWDYLCGCLVPGDGLEVDGERVQDAELRWALWAAGVATSLDAGGRQRLAKLEQQLARSPSLVERRDALARQEKALEAAVEEMLRYTAPGSVIPLAMNEDLEVVLDQETRVGGRTLRPGEAVRFEKGQMVNIAVDELNRRCPIGAGRFDPDRTGAFDITRADNKHHLSFGRAHSCIGARLATENMKRALQAVLRRFPGLELAGQPAPQRFDLFNGLASLPVRIPKVLPAVSSSPSRSASRFDATHPPSPPSGSP